MKQKKTCAAALAALLLATLGLQAQTPAAEVVAHEIEAQEERRVRIGVRAGLNMARLADDKAFAPAEGKNQAGWHVGAVVDVPLRAGFYLQPGLYLSAKGAKTELEETADALKELKKAGKIRYVGLSNFNQKDVERKKHKADSLMQSKEYESAVLVYQSIIHGERDDSVDKTFYGKVYACLGAAYGRLFLYEEAARMYEQAYAICEDADMLKAYLYCCSRALPEQKYVKMLSGNPAYLTMDPVVRESVQTVRREIDPDLPEEKLEQWEKEYRRIDKTAGIC